MTRKLEIELTEAQEKFLKKFYEDHHIGSKKNLATYMPIHVVENKEYIYIPYNPDYTVDGHICFVEDGEHVYHDIDELTEVWNENTDEEYNIPRFSEVAHEEVNDVYIVDEEDYLNAFDIENVEAFLAVDKYRPVAFFFIREEAEKYLQYQGHNLNKPRVYTYSPGYSNYGEYEHFFKLLQDIGKQLSLTKNNE